MLVVDDDRAVRRSSARLLARAGFTVLEAASAHEALSLAPEERVDVLLSDVVMPDMTGIDLADAARRAWPTAEILLYSAFTPAALARHGLGDDDAHEILSKPLASDALIDAVGAALERATGGRRG